MLQQALGGRSLPALGRLFRNPFAPAIGRLGDPRLSPHDAALLRFLRALAAGLVVLCHARIYTLGESAMSGLDRLAYAVTDCGTQAVFWLFILSGYLVGGPVIAEVAKSGQMDLRRYALLRLTRLYIVLVPALLVTALLDHWRISAFGMNSHAGFETAASYAPSTLIGNLFFLQTTVVPTFGSNFALWSLANEFWYYLVFPLLLAPFMLALSARLRLGIFLVGLVVLASLSVINFSIVWLFALWCMGAVARVVPVRLMKSRTLATALATAAVGLFPILHPHIGPLATLVVGVTFTNLLLTLRRNVPASNNRFLAGAQVFAAFSFSLYIVQLPLQHALTTALQRRGDPFLGINPHSLAAPVTIIALVAASLAFAYVFSLATEAHTGTLRRRLVGLSVRSLPADRQPLDASGP